MCVDDTCVTCESEDGDSYIWGGDTSGLWPASGGYEYYSSMSDYCLSDEILAERSCSGAEIVQENFVCADVLDPGYYCSEGACVRQKISCNEFSDIKAGASFSIESEGVVGNYIQLSADETSALIQLNARQEYVTIGERAEIEGYQVQVFEADESEVVLKIYC